ncbi:MAG: DUF721 domain-containing protein [Streptosporangiaceae bacterium]
MSTPDPHERDVPADAGVESTDAADAGERAREALREAKTDARRRGVRRGGDRSATRRTRARARTDDPLPLGAVIDELLDVRGWRGPTAVAGVFSRWSEVVGPEVAAHTVPETYDEGELVVVADSPAWATQVRLLAPTLVRRLCEELGDGAVRRVRVRGPGGPRRRAGEWGRADRRSRGV